MLDMGSIAKVFKESMKLVSKRSITKEILGYISVSSIKYFS